jgi:hypothetical protein
MGANKCYRLISQAVAVQHRALIYGFRNSSGSLAIFAAVRRSSSRTI